MSDWDNAPVAGDNSSDEIDPLGLLEESNAPAENTVPRRPGGGKTSGAVRPQRPQPVSPSPVEQDPVTDDLFTEDVPSAAVPVIGDEVLEETAEDKSESAENVVWVEAGKSIPDVGEEVSYEDDELGEVVTQSVKKPSKSKSGSKKKALGGIRLTDRDKQILEFMGRYRYATVAQLARRFETSEKTLRNRLPKLREGGLVESVFIVHARPSVWLVTSAGLNMIGMNLTAPSIRWGQVRHTMLLTELGITFEMSDENVITEREIRAAATRYSPTPRMKASVDFYKSIEQMAELEDEDVDTRVTTALTIPVHGRGIGHIPDMVLAREPFPNGASGSIAIELELTRKNLGEWRTVLTAFRDSDRFTEVYYFVTSKEVSKAMTRVVKALGAEDKIFIRMFEAVDDTARMFTDTDE